MVLPLDASAGTQQISTIVVSRLETNILGAEIQAVIEDAVCSRNRGLLHESVSRLEALPPAVLENVLVQNELALSYVLQHNFGKVLKLLGHLNFSPNDTKDRGFTQILRDYTGVHTDLMLAEAVKSTEIVYQTWLAERKVEDYSDFDVRVDIRILAAKMIDANFQLSMACLCYEIQELGRRFLGGDEWEDVESPASEPLRKLRLHVLQAGSVEDFLVVFRTERMLRSHEESLAILQDILRSCWQGGKVSMEGISYRRLDVEAWVRLHLSKELFANKQFAEMHIHLEMANKIFCHTHNNRGCLWVQLYTLKFCEGGVNLLQVDELKELAEQFQKAEDWNAAQICGFQIAQIHQLYNNRTLYHSTLRLLLQRQTGIESSVDYFTVPCALHTSPQAYRTQYHGSMFNFWEYYLGLLPKDIRTPQNIGILVYFCSIFFDVHPACSITTLRHLLAMTLSEQYSTWLGGGVRALTWAKVAFECAEQDELKAEAYHRIRLILSDDNTRVTDDPYGNKQREWDIAKKDDLAIHFEEEGKSGRFSEQFDTALQLLRLQLSSEITMNVTLRGEPWLENAKSVLSRLSVDKRYVGKLQIDYAMAFALFESGDYPNAVTALSNLASQCRQDSEDLVMKSGVMFTLGRAHMQIYRQNPDETHWNQSRRTLGAALDMTLIMETIDIGMVACCHCMLAELCRMKGFDDRANVTMALHHVTQAERLWSEERGSVSNLGGLNGLLTRYAVRHRGESGPSDVFAIALDACFGTGEFEDAWMWAQKAKARAFLDSLDASSEPDGYFVQGIGIPFKNSDQLVKCMQEISGHQGGIVYVDWVIAGDTIYMLTVRPDEKPQMHKLNIQPSFVQQWHSDLCDAQDDLSGTDADQTLAELDGLCEPLARSDVAKPGELLVLCPTKLIFSIPLHALHVSGQVLLERNPVVYTHSLSTLLQCFTEGMRGKRMGKPQSLAFFADPTGDTSGGVETVVALSESMQMQTFCGIEATREAFAATCHSSRLVHYHGHVTVDGSPFNNTMLFHSDPTGPEENSKLSAQNTFSWKLKECSPFICLIGCGSGQERIQTGDEPLGFPSSFIHAGASAVLATLWPIHDLDSGAAFSRSFYEQFTNRETTENVVRPKVVNLAMSLQSAALQIRSKEETRTPYFWAGFVLHGMWTFGLMD